MLHDVKSLRHWWLPGAVHYSVVQAALVPLLMGFHRHHTDSALQGAWARRSMSSRDTDERDRLCWRPALSRDLSWLVLRFAGHVVQDDGSTIGIVNNQDELRLLQTEVLGSDAQDISSWSGTFTSAGMHDDQLSEEEFLALRHVEVAARLEYMAEARGRPRPGQQHPDAEVENSDVEAGGDKLDSDPEFELDDALPGGDAEIEEQRVDVEKDYRPEFLINEEELHDTVHRTSDAQKHISSKQRTAKRELLDTFMKGHQSLYVAAEQSHAAHRCVPVLLKCTDQERKHASQQQQNLLDARKPQKQSCTQQLLHHSAGAMVSAQEPQSRQLDKAELPPSPLDIAIELIAISGVWRSKEQYLATLFMLEPIQQLWQKARQHSSLQRLQSVDTYARLAADIRARRVFLHGPGGSGKTFCVTEVVMKVVQMFFGLQAVQAIAYSNSAARLLKGKTMHAAGKMTRKNSLKAKHLRPTKKAKDALTLEWEAGLLLLGDEIGTAAPPLLAGVSRRASYGRRDLYNLDMLRVMEQPFGEMLLQVMMGDFLQLNPVASHTLLEAFLPSTTRVPGTPRITSDEDKDGYKVFQKMCENVILFTGTHRFKDKALPQLLEIMRTLGGV